MDLTIDTVIPAYAVSCSKTNSVIKFDDCLYVKVNPKRGDEAWYAKLVQEVNSASK